MIPARALRCHRTSKPQIQAAATAWAAAAAHHIGRCGSSSTASISSSSNSGGCSSGRALYGSSDRVSDGRSAPRRRDVGGGVSAAAAAMASSASVATTADGGGGGAAGPASLWDEIVTVYDRAQASGACSKTDTQVEVLHEPSLDVDFVLRVASALKAKPQGPPPTSSQQPQQQQQQGAAAGGAAAAAAAPPPAWRNPFLPPEPELFVRHLGPEHSLVLNKFNVVHHHVLVITREFRSQAEPLHGSDLAAALEVVKAMPSGGVAFYNCGPASGRSQPHKHLQVVPLPFTEGQPPLAPVHHLVEEAAEAAEAAGTAALQPLQLRRLPYRCFAAQLPESPTSEQLEATFIALLHLSHPGYSYVASPLLAGSPPADAATAAAVAAGSVSYNVLLTSSWMMLVPRRAERCGPLALNSLAFAGTMLVRSEDELEFVRQTGPAEILSVIGEPW
ncbi:hypothetical protein PLESTF_001535700 [Pleodorina starrii]|nr:hypothetical protein PLESTF_001535700 [Pleodorina starrii]